MKAQDSYDMIVTSPGDPRNPGSWSGTPLAILHALERNGYSILGVDSSLTRRPLHKLACWLHHRLSGLRFRYTRGRLARSFCAKLLQGQSRLGRCKKILHIAAPSLPLLEPGNGIEQYLFCDSTWDVLACYAPNVAGMTPRMMEVAEQYERQGYAHVKHFFPIAGYVRDNLVNHYGIDPERVTAVGTGRGRMEPFDGEKDYENGHLLFVAKVRFEDKGGPLLLEAFRIAQRRNPRLRLVIVGDERHKGMSDVPPNVSLRGHVSRDELQELFNTAALFAMPALYEPWGLVYLEALACKTPVLALNRNSAPETTEHGAYGFLVDDPSPDSVADAILEAFSDVGRLRRMGAAGQRHCLERYTWGRVAEKIADVVLGR